MCLDDANLLPFVALSYTWGDINDMLPIFVSGKKIPVTQNLHHVLQSLARSKFDQLPWVDALCIKQEDQHERAAQVALMGDIYSRAIYVLAFLSTESERFHLGLDFIEKSASNPELHFDPAQTPHVTVRGLNINHKDVRDSFIAFFGVSWWTRVWTVQEFILAREVRFHCGQRWIDARAVQQSINTWMSHERGCCFAAGRSPGGDSYENIEIPSESNGGLTMLAAASRMEDLMDISGLGTVKSTSFLLAMSLFRKRNCSNPLDRVFGLLGLHVPGSDIKDALTVDYSTVGRLYRNLAKTLIESSQTLDVLSYVLHRPNVQTRTQGLPSWVPDWDAIMDDNYHLMSSERIHKTLHLDASINSKPEWRVDDLSGSIITRGLRIAMVEAIAPGYPDDAPGATLRGKPLIAVWCQLAGLEESSHITLMGVDREEREKAFQNVICGGFVGHTNSYNISDAYPQWLEWFSHATRQNLFYEGQGNNKKFQWICEDDDPWKKVYPHR